MTAAHDTTQAAARIPTERVRELLALTPGPFGGTLVETSMVRDLAADLLDARSERDALAAALRTERAAREVAEASAALSARAAVDAARELGHVAAAAVARADAADAQHAALAGAVRAEREARKTFASPPRLPGVKRMSARRWEESRRYAKRDYMDAKDATDALLAGAPSGYVPAAVVREYLAAEETMRLVAADDHRRDTYHEWAKRHGAAMDAVDAARTALDAALAAATTTPTEGHG